jgi:hypothetical protein
MILRPFSVLALPMTGLVFWLLSRCDRTLVVVYGFQVGGGTRRRLASRSVTAPMIDWHHRRLLAAAAPPPSSSLFLSSNSDNEEGADLAAEFFKMAQEKGISLDARDVLEDEEEEDEEGDENDEEDDDEPEPNIPQGAINAFLGYDTGDVGEKLAGNVSLTNRQLYSEVKERVLDTAGGFVEFVQGARDDDDDDDEEEDDYDVSSSGDAPKPYEVPTTVPDSDLTAGEVVILVLNALLNNDVPTPNKGVEILFGYSSEGSQIKNEAGLTPAEYAEFLKETEYKVLFSHHGASIDKADYSFDGKKAFFTARLKTGPAPLDVVSVNFILSTKGVEDDACWLVDSMLIRPQSMRRRRRR